jgi:hypothetical protein
VWLVPRRPQQPRPTSSAGRRHPARDEPAAAPQERRGQPHGHTRLATTYCKAGPRPGPGADPWTAPSPWSATAEAAAAGGAAAAPRGRRRGGGLLDLGWVLDPGHTQNPNSVWTRWTQGLAMDPLRNSPRAGHRPPQSYDTSLWPAEQQAWRWNNGISQDDLGGRSLTSQVCVMVHKP